MSRAPCARARQVRMFRDKGNPKLIREYIEQVNEVSSRLDAAQTQAGEINAEEAKASGLTLSSQLLKLAKIVKTKQKKGGDGK